MNINPKDEFFDTGNTMIEVRDAVARIAGRSLITRGGFVREFIEHEYANRSRFLSDPGKVFDALVRHGYLEVRAQPRFESDEAEYRLTLLGGAFKQASAARPLKRATAEKQFVAFLDRVRQINNDPYSVLTVEKVVLFGSMLDESRDTVNDVDLAIRFRYHRDRREEAERTGHLSYKDWTMRPIDPAGKYKFEHEVMVFLRNRSRALSIGRIDDDGSLCGLPSDSTPHRVVFEVE
ncbi:hypothetical protein [Nocardia lijiangensis]|uniref:hypothetical protein n=1 Tax=Nocardia lijiangensis TaxID=299618 RepID=UPI003D72D70B